MIEAYTSAALLMDVRTLARLCKQSRSQDEIASLARAAILVGGSAMEALLLEAAYVKKRELYEDKKFRQYFGVADKFEALMGKKLSSICPDAAELWEQRNALGHSEPDNERTRFVGTRIDAEGAKWVSQTLDKFMVIVWERDMPAWFAHTTGLERPHNASQQKGAN